jgi:hypothetical protein
MNVKFIVVGLKTLRIVTEYCDNNLQPIEIPRSLQRLLPRLLFFVID